MLLVTYNDALQSKPAKCKLECPDDNVYYITKINNRDHLYFKRLGLKKIFKNKYLSF